MRKDAVFSPKPNPSCIACNSANGYRLPVHSIEVEYFRCRDCGHIWVMRHDGTTRDITPREAKRSNQALS